MYGKVAEGGGGGMKVAVLVGLGVSVGGRVGHPPESACAGELKANTATARTRAGRSQSRMRCAWLPNLVAG